MSFSSSFQPCVLQVQDVSFSVNVHPKKKNLLFPSQPSNLLTEKYRPQDEKSYIGNQEQLKTLIKWLQFQYRKITYQSASILTSLFQQEPANQKCFLLYGPPGIGKTTAISIATKICNFHIVETNASDCRNKSTLEKRLPQQDQKSIMKFLQPKSSSSSSSLPCFVFEEIDGINGISDRSGLTTLQKFIKESSYPSICTTNDIKSITMKSFLRYCTVLQFTCPSPDSILTRMELISQLENINISSKQIQQIIENCSNDIRSVLNYLQFWFQHPNSKKKIRSIRTTHILSEKDLVKTDIFAICSRLILDQTLPFDQQYELFFQDYNMIPSMIQENVLNLWSLNGVDHHHYVTQTKKRKIENHSQYLDLDYLAQVLDECSEGDIINNKIQKNMDWDLLPILATTSTLIPLSQFQSHHSLTINSKVRLQFPHSISQYSTLNKNLNLLKEKKQDWEQSERIKINSRDYNLYSYLLPISTASLSTTS